MFCFKEWIQIDSIKTDIYDELLRMSIFEQAARDTARLVLETLFLENDEDDEDDEDDSIEGYEDYKDDDDEDPTQDIPVEGGITGKSRRQLKKELKDSILWIRWHAILERQQAIAELKNMRDLHLEENPQFAEKEKVHSDPEAEEIKESADDDDDDDDYLRSLGTEFNLLDAIPLLEKTGYFDPQFARVEAGRNENKFKEMVRRALYAAAKEEGNDLPDGVDAEEIKKKLPEQKKIFLAALHDYFLKRYHSIFRDSDSSHGFYRNKEKIRGGKLFHDPQDVWGKFAEIVLNMITSRKVSKKEMKPSSWGPVASKSKIGQIGRLEIEKDNDETIKRIIKLLGFTLSRIKDKAREETTKAHTVSQRLGDEIKSRSDKSSLISKDTDEETKGKTINGKKYGTSFYEDYLKSIGSTIYNADGSIKIPTPPQPVASSKEDKLRLEIIEHIVYLSSRYKELSLDPNEINKTLLNYQERFLGTKRKSHNFIGLIRTKDSESGVGEEGGYDPVADDGVTRGGGGAESIPTPAAAVSRDEGVLNLMGDLKKALDELARDPKNKIGLLAFCIKFGLNCSLDGKPSSVEGIRNIITYLNGDGKTVKGSGKQHTCLGRLMSLGVPGMDTGDKIARQMTSIIPYPEKSGQPWESYRNGISQKLNAVVEKLCEKLSGNLPQQPAINTRFDASRLSPLSRFRKPV